MRYTVSHVSVIGTIWMPACTCAMDYSVSQYDIENMREDDGSITRESVEDWLGCHSGDFQSIEDFAATIEDGENTLDFAWSSDESEMTYADCMYGEEE